MNVPIWLVWLGAVSLVIHALTIGIAIWLLHAAVKEGLFKATPPLSSHRKYTEPFNVDSR